MRSIDVSFGPLPAIGELEREWRDLEARTDCSFFTSWSWMGCWLENLPATLEPKLLRAQIGTQAVGLAIFVPRKVHRHKVLSSRALYLHATGDVRFDALTIESNGLLVDRAHADAVAHRMIEHLATDCPQWEELFLEATSIRPPAPAFEGTTLRLRRWEQRTYYIDLARIGLSDSDHCRLLRPKVRYYIRRTIKAYAEHGVVRARAAADLPQAIEFFDRMRALHQANWVAKGLPGAFASAFVCRFHNRLISRCFDRGEIQLLLIEAGERPIGYLYNFVHRGIVSNYQAGIDYKSTAINNSPGLAAHFLCARFNASAGHRVYDLMMGDHEYKTRICTDTGTLYWTVVQRPRLKFRVEDALRSLRAHWLRHATQSIADPAE
jgi:Acetyltransferase (GNAT) domain